MSVGAISNVGQKFGVNSSENTRQENVVFIPQQKNDSFEAKEKKSHTVRNTFLASLGIPALAGAIFGTGKSILGTCLGIPITIKERIMMSLVYAGAGLMAGAVLVAIPATFIAWLIKSGDRN